MKDARFLFKCGIIICKVFVTIYGITVPLKNPNKCLRPFYIILWLPWRHDTVERPHQASGLINSGEFPFGVHSLRELYVFCWSIASLNSRMLNRWQFDEVQCSFSSFGFQCLYKFALSLLFLEQLQAYYIQPFCPGAIPSWSKYHIWVELIGTLRREVCPSVLWFSPFSKNQHLVSSTFNNCISFDDWSPVIARNWC